MLLVAFSRFGFGILRYFVSYTYAKLVVSGLCGIIRGKRSEACKRNRKANGQRKQQKERQKEKMFWSEHESGWISKIKRRTEVSF